MNPKIQQFLTTERMSVLSVVLPEESSHSAAMHFAVQDQPLSLVFSTHRTSKKASGLLSGRPAKASLVIGFSEEHWTTLQLSGDIRPVVGEEAIAAAKKLFYAKYPESLKYADDPETLFLVMTPYWWRYSDYTVDPVMIETSEE